MSRIYFSEVVTVRNEAVGIVYYNDYINGQPEKVLKTAKHFGSNFLKKPTTKHKTQAFIWSINKARKLNRDEKREPRRN